MKTPDSAINKNAQYLLSQPKLLSKNRPQKKAKNQNPVSSVGINPEEQKLQTH